MVRQVVYTSFPMQREKDPDWLSDKTLAKTVTKAQWKMADAYNQNDHTYM